MAAACWRRGHPGRPRLGVARGDVDLEDRRLALRARCPSKELRAEVPTLESALASLASASSKLAAKFPALGPPVWEASAHQVGQACLVFTQWLWTC